MKFSQTSMTEEQLKQFCIDELNATAEQLLKHLHEAKDSPGYLEEAEDSLMQFMVLMGYAKMTGIITDEE